MKKTGAAVLLLIVIVIGVIAFNTFGTRAWPSTKAAPLPNLPDSAVSHLSQAIQIQTVSPQDADKFDTIAFTKYRLFLEQAYPLIHRTFTRNIIAGYSYVYTLKGTDQDLAPMILMAHYDVVPVEPSAVNRWTVRPFGGELRADSVWGRGAADDKGNMISILEAVEALIKKGFTPKRTIMLCFGHNEESTGTGAIAIVEWLKQQKIKADLVLDEGGEISFEKFPDVKRPVAMIGVGEKGYVTYELSVEKTGGHSSRPDRETAIDILSHALVKMREKYTPRRILPSTREMLSRLTGSSNSLRNKVAVNNMWLFEGLEIYTLAQDKDGLAMVSTTIVPTILESGIRENVIPSNARAIVNARILPGEAPKDVEDFIRRNIDDDRVKIKQTGDFATEPTNPPTDFNSPAFKTVADAVAAIQDDVIPVPIIMLGATDSRNYRAISNGVINFSPFTDSKGFHGIDERVAVKGLRQAIAFYTIILAK